MASEMKVKLDVDLGEETLEALKSLGIYLGKIENLAKPTKGSSRGKIVKLSQLKKNDVVDLEELPETHKVDLKTAGLLLGLPGKSKSTLRRYLSQGKIPQNDSASTKGEFLWSIGHLKRFIAERDDAQAQE